MKSKWLVVAAAAVLVAGSMAILVGLGVVGGSAASQVSYTVETADSTLPYLEMGADESLELGALGDLLPAGFPPPRLPEENIPTTEKIEVGRALFYDTRLSGNGTQSCSSCHVQSLAFSDNKPTSSGSTGEALLRNSPGLINIAWNASLNWAHPGLTSLEKQVLIPLFGEFPVEMGGTGFEDAILAQLREDADYQERFAAAFPAIAAAVDDGAGEEAAEELISFHTVTQALASFVRSLISSDSPYDQYQRGDKSVLSDSARRGMDLFFSERFECHHCHTGFNFTTSTMTAYSTFSTANFQNNGLYNVDGAGAYPPGSEGVYEITGIASDMGRFRPPTLRNVALTAPYMHDGSIATLREVIEHYAAGGRTIVTGDFAGDGSVSPYKSPLVPGFEATEQEIGDLVAFLHALTDETFVTNPAYSNPFVGE